MIPIPRSSNFEKNYQKVGPTEYCLICGKALGSKKYASVHTYSGAYIMTEAEATALQKKDAQAYDAAESGFWLIGNDCLRRNSQLKPYIQ